MADAHPLIWYIDDSGRLGRRSGEVFADPASVLVVPTIVLAEARHLWERGRIGVDWPQIIGVVKRDPRFVVGAFDEAILDLMPTGLEMHDAIICATAMAYGRAMSEAVAVVTKDRAIRLSGIVPTVW